MTGPWTLGWDALVACGTLGLAGATGFLAWNTKALASTTAEDVRAQWRPAIIQGRGGDTPLAGGPLAYDEVANRLFVGIRNVGRGPALFVRVLLDPDNNSPDVWDLGAVGPGDEVQLSFSGVYKFDGAKQVLVDYRDLQGHTYASSLVVDKVVLAGGDEYRCYNVRLFDGVTLTPHGDAVAQPGLRALPT